MLSVPNRSSPNTSCSISLLRRAGWPPEEKEAEEQQEKSRCRLLELGQKKVHWELLELDTPYRRPPVCLKVFSRGEASLLNNVGCLYGGPFASATLHFACYADRVGQSLLLVPSKVRLPWDC